MRSRAAAPYCSRRSATVAPLTASPPSRPQANSNAADTLPWRTGHAPSGPQRGGADAASPARVHLPPVVAQEAGVRARHLGREERRAAPDDAQPARVDARDRMELAGGDAPDEPELPPGRPRGREQR